MDGGNDILDFARSLAGDDADTALLQTMCAAAAAELESRLREGLTPEELGERFSAAAGVLALSIYCAVKHPETLKSFRAGSLSVEYADGEASPERLRKTAEELLSACLVDRGFGFLGVPG